MSIITIEQMRSLVERGLAREKVDSNGYSTFKYHNKVFYKNLWGTDAALLECRGIVFDENHEVAQRPFKKVFNLGENGTGDDIDDEHEVLAVRKVNGFMASASSHKGDFLVSTTGTTTSDFADMAREYLIDYIDVFEQSPDYTFIFEICDSDDPHIVEEMPGAYLLGVRHKATGYMLPYRLVHSAAHDEWGMNAPEFVQTTFGEAKRLAKEVDHEGFMLYLNGPDNHMIKIKSPHYLSKKALMRMGKRSADMMFDNPQVFRERLDEEFYGIHQHLLRVSTKEAWKGADEQDRRWYIEDFFQRFPDGNPT